MSYKPANYPSISPYLLVQDAAALVAFLEAVFEGKVRRKQERPDGSIMHVEVQIDDSVVMIGESTEEWKPSPAMIHIYVKDVDAVWHKAIQAGATAQQEPGQKEGEEDKRGGFLGPCGNSWWIATQQ